VYVGRPTRWGNPFVLGHEGNMVRWTHWVVIDTANRREPVLTRHETQEEARKSAADLYALHRGPLGMYEWDDDDLAALRRALAGRDLACWCPEGQPCHADFLLEVANR
jgi:hypothetical protein